MSDFYCGNPGNKLRLGDVVGGFVSVRPSIEKPENIATRKIALEIEQPEFMVILMPCCSIKREILIVAPLEHIRTVFLTNPFWKENLMRINEKMEPEKCVSPEVWKKMSFEEKQRRFGPDLKKKEYTNDDVFIYDRHDLLPEYKFDKKDDVLTMNYYMISFANITRINCKAIKQQNQTMQQNKVIDTKRLELSIYSRELLRNKLAFWYGRPPLEDQIA